MNEAEVQATLAAARRAQHSGHPAEAERLYRAVLARAGERPVALNALGVMALGRGEPAAAGPLFERAIATDPRAPELWMNLARVHREKGDATAELTALDGALAIDRVHLMAVIRKAELLDRLERFAEAADLWAGVLTLGAGVADGGPAFAEVMERARDRVARHRAGFAAAIDGGLADARAAVPAASRRRVDACIDHALGRRAIYANQCAGLHFPWLPAEEYFERRHFPWLADLEARTPEIRAELQALLSADPAAMRPYVTMESGTPANKWTPLDGSPAWTALHLWKDGVRDEAACALAPRTAAIVAGLPLSDLPGRTPTVFFSLLAPGAHLPAHTGVSNVRTIIHLPLIVPPGCTFRVGGETRAWVEGEAWAFDDTIEHEAWNRSDATRAILILDVWNPYIDETERDLLRRFYTIANGTGDAAAPSVAG